MNVVIMYVDLFKGWVYVFVIVEDQVNKGLVKVYYGDNMGKLMLVLFKEVLVLLLDCVGGLMLWLIFGCLCIVVVEIGLNCCELILLLLDVVLVDVDGFVVLGDDVVFVVIILVISLSFYVEVDVLGLLL